MDNDKLLRSFWTFLAVAENKLIRLHGKKNSKDFTIYLT